MVLKGYQPFRIYKHRSRIFGGAGSISQTVCLINNIVLATISGLVVFYFIQTEWIIVLSVLTGYVIAHTIQLIWVKHYNSIYQGKKNK